MQVDFIYKICNMGCMQIEKKQVIGSDIRNDEAVDVTILGPGKGYRLLSEIGPYYVTTELRGVVIRRIVVHETGDAIVVVKESENPPRVRTSTAVLPLKADLSTPRPGYRPLVPGVKP